MEAKVNELPSYLRGLLDYIVKDERIVVGLHSGTSADGPTAVVAKVSGFSESATIEPIAHESFEYEQPLKERVFDLFNRETATVDKIAQAEIAIGESLAKAAHQIVNLAGISLSEVDLIASSGQVCYQVIDGQRSEHRWLGDRAITSFLDLGSGAVIAERTGVTTISNLRQRDIAAGGLGVPTVTLGDWIMFRHPSKGRIIQNIGGIANPTVIPANAELSDVFAFDNGPGNMVIDLLVRRITDGRMAFDKDGTIASAGRVNSALLSQFMEHSFVVQEPPKGAAQQLFGKQFVDSLYSEAQKQDISDEDLVATVTEWTVEAIRYAYERFVFPRSTIDEVFIAGGGAFNETIVSRLRERLEPLPVQTTEALGIPVDAREVLAMVAIANETVHGRPGNAWNATGAEHGVVSGDITPGSTG